MARVSTETMGPAVTAAEADYDQRCYRPCRNNPLVSPARCGPCHLLWPRCHAAEAAGYVLALTHLAAAAPELREGEQGT